jgi:hypothetical protein
VYARRPLPKRPSASNAGQITLRSRRHTPYESCRHSPKPTDSSSFATVWLAWRTILDASLSRLEPAMPDLACRGTRAPRAHCRRTAHTIRIQTSSPAQRGFVLAEVLTALAITFLGVLPLATLGPAGHRWLRAMEAIATSTRLAVQLAELPSLRDPLSEDLTGIALTRVQRCPEASRLLAVVDACADGWPLVLIGPVDDGVAVSERPAWIAFWSSR